MTDVTTDTKPVAAVATLSAKAKLSRRSQRALGRSKRKQKLNKDSAYAKAYFEAKSKRSAEKKSAFRKKKKHKK